MKDRQVDENNFWYFSFFFFFGISSRPNMFNFNVLGWLIVWMTNIPALFIVFLWTFEEAVVFRVLIFGIKFYNRKGPSWRLCVWNIDADVYEEIETLISILIKVRLKKKTQDSNFRTVPTYHGLVCFHNNCSGTDSLKLNLSPGVVMATIWVIYEFLNPIRICM